MTADEARAAAEQRADEHHAQDRITVRVALAAAVVCALLGGAGLAIGVMRRNPLAPACACTCADGSSFRQGQ